MNLFQFRSSHCFLVLAFVGFAFVGIEGYTCFKSDQAADWDAVSGQITECRRVTSHMRSIGDSTRRARYTQKLGYDYTYQGKSRTGKRVGFDDLISTVHYTGFDLTGRTLGLHRGKSVDVFVNPRDPNEAVLHRDFGLINVILLGIGVVASAIGSVGLLKQATARGT